MNKNQPEVDCTRRCKSRSHGQALTSAITKRSVSDTALASFIKATCGNFNHAFDYEGRTALHMAASRGRTSLMDWLVRHSSNAFINAKDRESGYTPLHRSIFYGQIQAAVTLLKIGVNSDIVDKDDYKALDHSLLDRQYMYKLNSNDNTDVYVWGSNCNYTLGTGTQQPRNTPELLTCFSRSNACVKQVCLGKFHSVWLTSSAFGKGDVWCCGQVSRSGAPQGTALRPVQLRLMEPCDSIAITLNSTVLLMESGVVLQYSHNTADISQPSNKTLATIKLPSTKPVLKLSRPLGVAAGRSHVVVWNARAVYTWGTNLGQLGHSQGENIVSAPKRVAISMNNKEDVEIQLAAAADAATVVTTSRGDVYLLHNHIAKKIAIKQINLRQVCVDAKVSDTGVYSRVTVILLTNVGQLHIWQDTTNALTRCVFGLTHQIVITHTALTHDALYFTTKYGEAFIGHISRKTTPTSQAQPIRREKEKDNKKSSLVKFLEKDDCTSVRIVRIPNVHRATSIVVDNEGLNFACLQVKPNEGLTSLPELSPSCMSKHMETLLETASEDDLLHDVIFKVGGKHYPAHIFVVASNSEHLYKLFQEQQTNPGDKPIVVLENVLPEVFDRVLRFMYTGRCDVTELGPCGLKIRREDVIAKEKKEMDNIDNEAEYIENSSEISAFEVYNNKSNKKGGKSRRPNEPAPRHHIYCDPVKLVQAAAKRLQLMTLHEWLDKFFYKDGTICLKESATYTKDPPPPLNRDSFTELVDTNVCSKDNVLVPAHKCVLAARLEYFHGMFMHSWTESKLLSKVTLPISHGILKPIIDFLYTDSCPEVENSDSIDFICSMLVVADQLFIMRLREMCEVALYNLVTLKNCAELCQFAHTYNATQLKQYCMEFLSLNIGCILENRSLDILEDNLLEDITNYYCNFNPIMSSRVITPFYNAPDDEVINEFSKNYPIDLDLTDEDIKRDDSLTLESTGTKKKRNSKKIEYTENEKARMRYESVSSVTSLDLSNDVVEIASVDKTPKDTEKGAREKQEKWIEVPSSQQKQQKIVQARLKAITQAVNIEAPSESFAKLTKNNSFSLIPVAREPDTASTSRMSVSPKESLISEMGRSPQGNLVISHIGPKLSQKQRKKLALQPADEKNVSKSSSQNLNEYMDELSVNSPPEKPKNPWKICAPPVANSSPNKQSFLEFNQILADQKKQKDDSSRIMTKPLNMTQLEDRAIEELERFYNVNEVDDELITVRRIELQVSSPQWNHTANKLIH